MKIMKKSFIKLIFVFLIATFFTCVVQSNADTIVLKNGNKIEVDKAWEEDGFIKANRGNGLIGFPKDSVGTVIHEKEEQHDSFEFDMWKPGITVEKAINIAQSYELPLARAGDVTLGNKIHPNVYKHIKTTNAFHYRTKLMDRYADITLYFTPTSRLLHNVTVRITVVGAKTEEFRGEILSMLKNKYGNKNKYGLQLFGNSRIWKVEDKYTVKMVTMPGYIDIEYADNALGNQNAAEQKKIKNKKRADYTEKDSPKF